MAAINTRLDQMKSNQNNDRGESSHRRNDGESSHGRTNYGSMGSGGTLIPRVTKLDFPRFNAYHLEGEAQLWYQLLKLEGEITWANLKEGLYASYGPTKFDDNFSDLTKLKQIGTVKEYQGHFERLLSRVGRLPPSQQVCYFISGLKGHLRVDVQALKPISLFAAVGLAHLFEAQCHSQQRLLPSRENEESLPLSLSVSKTIKTLTPIELNER
ncbi:Retrovirus-related Pol polyprotein from transposon 297 [Fagus crenata]